MGTSVMNYGVAHRGYKPLLQESGSAARIHLEAGIEEIIVFIYFWVNEVKELSIMFEIAVFKGGFASSFVLQSAVGAKPLGAVNQCYHVARFVRWVGNTTMPQPHVSDEGATLLCISTDRGTDFAACFLFLFIYLFTTDLQM
jgi:hypothetical protein